jgi:hypothetical protein
MSSANIQFFFTLQTQLKLHHWQTRQFSTHKAIDDILKKLDGIIDEYVETYMGRYGRATITKATSMIVLKNLSEKNVVKFVEGCFKYLEGEFIKGLKADDTALMNLRDELAGALQQLLYLFTLHG